MKDCAACGTSNPATKDFCANCGEFLGWGYEPPKPEPMAPPPVVAAPEGVGVAVADEVVAAQEEAREAVLEANRVREEADARAKAETEAAVRKAVNDTRHARLESLLKAEEEVASAQAGGQPDNAEVLEEIRRTASERAKAELAMAELQAARKARRAREEAYAKARNDSAVADRRAKEKVARAAALVAAAAPTAQTDAQPAAGAKAVAPIAPAPQRPKQSQPAPAKPQPRAVQPARVAPRLAPTDEVAVAPVVLPGQRICSQCGSGNDPARRFCKRCGNSFIVAEKVAKVSWWRRLFGRDTTDPTGAGENEVPRATRLTEFSATASNLVRGLVLLVPLVAVFLALGPTRNVFQDGVADVRRQFLPSGNYVDRPTINEPGATGVPNCTQDLKPQTCFLSDRKVSNVEFFRGIPNATVPAFTVTFGTNASHPTPTDMFKIGFVSSVPNGAQPAPKSVTLVPRGKDGTPLAPTELTLRDTGDFQDYDFSPDDVTSMDVFVGATHGPDPNAPYAINEIEFFSVA